jgi:hypothetical protein
VEALYKKVNGSSPAQDAHLSGIAVFGPFFAARPGTRFDVFLSGRVGVTGIRNFRQALASPYSGFPLTTPA